MQSETDGDSKLLKHLQVTPIHCRIIPGHFILRCYRREIHFTWIPPKQPIKKAMVKYKEHQAAQYSTMSGHGWGSAGVQIRNHTITGLRPNTIYEFGLNVIYNNNTFARFPTAIVGKDMCACKTHADVPSTPKNLQYHYLRDNQYTLEWTPSSDNGEPILSYDLQAIHRTNQLAEHGAKWHQPMSLNMTENQANFTLDSTEHTILQLRAVNKVGAGHPAFLSIRPPVRKYMDGSNSQPVFGSLHHMSNVVAYSLLSAGLLFFVLLLFALFVYRKRRANGKMMKHPFLISFNPSKRLNSGSGNDSFGLGAGASDLTTSGLPVDLSALEPLWNQEVNSLYGMGKSDLLSFEQVTQIPAANIRFHRYIGCGAFGKVWEGWLNVTDVDGERFEKVALKVRNIKSLSEAEFRREATLMHRYQHANIVRFFGVSFDSPGQQCLVLEMMDQGNLRDYLHRARPRIAPNVAANMFAAAAICAAGGSNPATADPRTALASENSSMNTGTTGTAAGGTGGCGMTAASSVITLTAQLDLPALMCIMRDIANGCRYLEEQHFVHRDIAARNCLVSHNHPSGRIVKLCDFGLARDIYKNDCYRKRNEPKLPVRWMSPEAIRDGLFTTKSDVWAFSVTCWEVMTLGADPFYGRANLDVMNLVIGGHVLGRPENCPEELYSQMLQCWSRFTEMRPSFADLVKKMNEFVQSSQNLDSPFSGPFLVTLPLPRSLPDSNGQPLFTCGSSENQTRQISDAFSDPSHQQCQRRASLNESRSNAFQMQQSIASSRAHEMNTRTSRDTVVIPSWIEAEDCARGYLIGPLNSTPRTTSTGSAHQTTELYRTQHENHPSYLVPSTTTYDGSGGALPNAVDAIVPRTPIAAKSKSCQTAQNIKGLTTFGTSTRRSANHSKSFSNGDSVSRPNSLSGNLSRSTSGTQQYETQPIIYRTLGHRSYRPDPRNSLTKSLLIHMNNQNSNPLVNNAETDHASELKFRHGTINYGLVETGGGLDSLGYQRPTWTSRLLSSPLSLQYPPPISPGFTSADCSVGTTTRCYGCRPTTTPCSQKE